jgi:hypothetical protein
MPRASRLELYLPAPEELSYAVGVRVLDASIAQEPMSLREREREMVAISPLFMASWSSSKVEGFGRDQLLATTLIYPAFEQLLETTLSVR